MMIVKSIPAIVVSLAILSGFAAAPALADSGSKIVIVDMQKVLSTSKAGQDAQKKYEVELKKAQTEIDSKKADYDKMQQSVEKQKDSLNQKALAEKADQLSKMETELKRSFADKREDLRKENARIVGELVAKVRKVVEEMGKSDGYQIVLEKNAPGVLYADDKVDITDAVVKKFDAK